MEKGSSRGLIENRAQLPEDEPVQAPGRGEAGLGEGSPGRPGWKLAAANGHSAEFIYKGVDHSL